MRTDKEIAEAIAVLLERNGPMTAYALADALEEDTDEGGIWLPDGIVEICEHLQRSRQVKVIKGAGFNRVWAPRTTSPEVRPKANQ